MYKQIGIADKSAKLRNGVVISPVLTMEDEHGGRVHIWIDDNCYQLGVEREDRGDLFVVPTTHIFPEAFRALKGLPDLAGI